MAKLQAFYKSNKKENKGRDLKKNSKMSKLKSSRDKYSDFEFILSIEINNKYKIYEKL